jgi:hypothetical protein
MPGDADTPARSDQTAQLEQAFILEFIERQGYTLEEVRALPAAEADALRKAASSYASARLAEMESRAQYVHEIHDANLRK